MTQLALLLGMFITTTRQAINVSMLIFVIGVVAQVSNLPGFYPINGNLDNLLHSIRVFVTL
jgi:hypothetical protein